MNMHRPLAWREILIAVLIGSASLAASVAIIAAAEIYIRVQQEKVIADPSRIDGRRGYSSAVVIQSVDMQNGTMVVTIHNFMAGQDIDMKLKMAPDFRLERQDAILEGALVVGRSDLRPGTTTDLTLGTHGWAFLRYSGPGPESILYLLYGMPFPHP